MEHVSRIFIQIQYYRNEGHGWQFIADMLNAGEISAPRGGVWYRLRRGACMRLESAQVCS